MSFWTDLIGVLGTSLKIGLAKPATIDASGLTAARTFTLPDVGGTLGVISRITASPSADQNDYAPTGFGTASSVFLTPTVSVVITGFSATGVSDGAAKIIRNDTTDKLVVLADQSASSTAANRISVSNSNHRAHHVLYPGDSATLGYDATASRWKVLAVVVGCLGSWVTRTIIANGAASSVGLLGLANTAQETSPTGSPPASGSYSNSLVREAYSTTTTAAASSGVRAGQVHVIQGDAAGRGGFLVRQRFGANNNPGNAGSSFVGLEAATTAIGNVDASSLINCIGFGSDATQANFHLIKNDGSGTATSTDLGSNFAWASGNVFDAIIYAAPNGGGISWAIWRSDDLTVAPKVGYETTDIPSNATPLMWHLHVTNRAAAAAYGLLFMSMDCLTPN